MSRLRPDTFALTLPDGRRVTCLRREARAIRQDIGTTGNVYLRSDPLTGVYRRIPPDSMDGRAMRQPGGARRVG